jgi:hypothetical protein
MRSLQNADKYRMLSSLIILGPGTGPEGYQLPQDAYRFIALGGMTEIKVGAPIYFSERVTHYAADQFAKVLLHEVIHHVVSQGLSEDEVFVNDLTSSILTGIQSPMLAQSFIYSSYFRQDYISKKQLLDAINVVGFSDDASWAAAWFVGSLWKNDRELTDQKEKLIRRWRMEIEAKLPENLVDLPASQFLGVILDVTDKYNDDVSDAANKLIHQRMKLGLIKYAKELNPAGPELNYDYFGCKKDFRGFLGLFNQQCEGSDIIRMRDLFVPEI